MEMNIYDEDGSRERIVTLERRAEDESRGLSRTPGFLALRNDSSFLAGYVL